MSSGIIWVSSLFVASMLILMPTITVCASKLSKPTQEEPMILANVTCSLNIIPQLKTYRKIDASLPKRTDKLRNTCNASIVTRNSSH